MPKLKALIFDVDGFIKQLHQSKTRHYVQLLQSGAIPLRPGRRVLLQVRLSSHRVTVPRWAACEYVHPWR